jgi:hypothetical protein
LLWLPTSQRDLGDIDWFFISFFLILLGYLLLSMFRDREQSDQTSVSS